MALIILCVILISIGGQKLESLGLSAAVVPAGSSAISLMSTVLPISQYVGVANTTTVT